MVKHGKYDRYSTARIVSAFQLGTNDGWHYPRTKSRISPRHLFHISILGVCIDEYTCECALVIRLLNFPCLLVMRFFSYRDPLISRHFLLYLPYHRSAFPRISFLVLFYGEKYFSHRGLDGEECRVSSPNRSYRTDTLRICSVALIGTRIIRTQAGICVSTCVSADKYSRISLLPIIVSL